MGTHLVGSKAAKARKHVGALLRQAVAPVLERLEDRRLLSAGDLDLTWGWGTGFLGLQQPLWETSMAPTKAPKDGKYFNSVDPLRTDRGEMSVQDMVVDAGGKIVTAGAALGKHLYVPDEELTMPDPKDPSKEIKVKLAEMYDLDFYVGRYSGSGGQDYDLPLPSLANAAGDRDLRTNKGVYPPTEMNTPTLRDFAQAVLIDGTDDPSRRGTIVVIGENSYAGAPGSTITLVRYAPTAGLVTEQINMVSGPFPWSVTDAAMQADGKIVVVGSTATETTGRDFRIWRFNPDFTLDTSFGVGGMATQAFTSYSNDEITSVALQHDGKIVVVGYSDDRSWSVNGRQKFMVARYTDQGVLDTTFDRDGLLEIADFGDRDARGTAVMIQPDNKIVVMGVYDAVFGVGAGGMSYDSTAVVRLNSNGTIDEGTFGARGRVFYVGNSSQSMIGQALAMESTGKILVGGLTDTSGVRNAFVSRLTVDGRLDANYASDGIREISVGGNASTGWDYAVSLVVGQDDKAVLAVNRDTTRFESGTAGMGLVGAHDAVLVRLQTENRAPQADLLTKDVVIRTPGTTQFDFLVSYTDDGFIDRDTLDGSEIQITGPNGFVRNSASVLQITTGETVVDSDSNQFTVRYRITVDNNWWADSTNNGAYTIVLKGNDVRDTMGAAATTRNLGQFAVNINTPDTQPPSATLVDLPASSAAGNVGVVVGGRANLQFTVRYTDADGNVMRSLLGNGDLRVTGPNGYSELAQFVSADKSGNSSTIVATYSIPAPGGSWEVLDNGTYTISVLSNQISDDYAVPNYVPAGSIANFNVAIVPGKDVAPTARLEPLPPVTAVQGALTFSVTYTRSAYASTSALIDANSFINNNSVIRVVGPGVDGYATYAGIASQTGSGTQATSYTVLYQIMPTGGQWSESNNGSFTVSIAGNQVHDTDTPFNYVPAQTLGTFTVDISPDLSRPRAALEPIPLVTTSSATLGFTVTYTDLVGIKTSSLQNSGAIRVTGPNGYDQMAELISVGGMADGTTQVGSYQVRAPGGTWDAGDSGTYTLFLKKGKVENLNGAFNRRTVLGTFTVSIQVSSVSGGLLMIQGSTGNDTIRVERSGDNYVVTVNGTRETRSAAEINGVVVDADAGDDSVAISGNIANVSVYGGRGRDTLYGGAGNDLLVGKGGADLIVGGAGDDTILGGGGNDTLRGGKDNDDINGGIGEDMIFGGAGNNIFRTRDGLVDTIDGRGGNNIFEDDEGLDIRLDLYSLLR